jgi:hypothetical protein
MKEKKVYMIRNKLTGLYSTGGGTHSPTCGFSKAGKMWATLGALKNHLRMFDNSYRSDKGNLVHLNKWMENIERRYKDCEVIEVEVIYSPLNVKSVEDYITELWNKDKKV